MHNINYQQRLPQNPPPIYMVGAGGIVNDAHLPAYKLAGFTVAAIYDIDFEKATTTAKKFGINTVCKSLQQLINIAPVDAVYDVALPGSAILEVLTQLPEGAAVLIQKPMGEDIVAAQQILAVARQKSLLAAVNFQLRYAPFINAARNIIHQGLIGTICDIEVNINVYTPWHLWTFLDGLARVEILYHSIHYVDLVRNFLGNPGAVFARTIKHPSMKNLASVRTNIIMEYGEEIRANILTNHCHLFGLHNQHSYIKFEGTKGAIKIKLGLLMNYPKGEPDEFEYVTLEAGKEPEWKKLEIEGTWFPHAFVGSMSQLMLAKQGTITRPDNSVEDCIYTMACVEAAYKSNEIGGVKLKDVL